MFCQDKRGIKRGRLLGMKRQFLSEYVCLWLPSWTQDKMVGMSPFVSTCLVFLVEWLLDIVCEEGRERFAYLHNVKVTMSRPVIGDLLTVWGPSGCMGMQISHKILTLHRIRPLVLVINIMDAQSILPLLDIMADKSDLLAIWRPRNFRFVAG